jgi:hypothetical protein
MLLLHETVNEPHKGTEESAPKSLPTPEEPTGDEEAALV